MSTVRAKFNVTGITSNGAANEDDKGSSVSLSPVVGGSAENDSFYKWTPGGNILLSTINPEATKFFQDALDASK